MLAMKVFKFKIKTNVKNEMEKMTHQHDENRVSQLT